MVNRYLGTGSPCLSNTKVTWERVVAVAADADAVETAGASGGRAFCPLAKMDDAARMRRAIQRVGRRFTGWLLAAEASARCGCGRWRSRARRRRRATRARSPTREDA